MKISDLNRKRFTRVTRWTARIIGTLIFLLITAIAIGESDGLFNPMEQPVTVRIELLSMLIMWVGLIVAWKWEGIGSVMILGGFALFWIAERRLPALNMAFGPLLLSGLLYLAAWWGARGEKHVT